MSGNPQAEGRVEAGSRLCPVSDQKASGFKALFSPSWVIGLLVVLGFSYLAFTILAPWQLGKNDAIVKRNEQIEKSFDTAPLAAREVFSGALTPDQEWARVEATGHYISHAEVLLRLRSEDGHPGFQALTPFSIDDGPVVLVNRGYVVQDKEAGTLPDIAAAPEGTVSIVGLAMKNEDQSSSAPITESGRQQVYSINTQQVGTLSNLTLAEDYLQLSEGQAGVLTAIPLPQLDRGNHLSYGLQWIAFGVMVPIAFGYFVWSEITQRRRSGKEDSTSSAETQKSSSLVTTTDVHSRDVRSRYGGEMPGAYIARARNPEERF